MKLAPALVPLEAWFWYMLFLDLLSAKPCLRFLIELIEQILHTIKLVKSYEVRLYTHNGSLREIETSQEKSETGFWRSCYVD